MALIIALVVVLVAAGALLTGIGVLPVLLLIPIAAALVYLVVKVTLRLLIRSGP